MSKASKKGGKKGKGKKKKKAEVDPHALTDVDRTFYELTITDLNRKLARLRSLTEELEIKNEEMQQQLVKMDEDRADIIIFLKRMLQEKTDEIAMLQERLRAVQEERIDESEKFLEKIADLEGEYRQLHEQLTSEIKLLEGKLNALEEFRIQRDELMKKFEDQEIQMEEQEKRHKMEMYDIERKFIIGKDKLKKEMEAKLLQLSAEFHDVTELRIAATTHRVIRENIAINNELDEMLGTQKKLHTENTSMKQRDRTLRQEAQLHEQEKIKAVSKVRVQLKVIEELTNEHKTMSKQLDHFKDLEKDMDAVAAELRSEKTTVELLNYKIRLLEQNLHASKCLETLCKTDYGLLQDENRRLTNVLFEAVVSIKDALEVRASTDQATQVARRENLLQHLFELLSESEDKKPRKPSLETVGSMTATYARGDLGFVPMQTPLRPTIKTIRHMESQTGVSLDEMIEENAMLCAQKVDDVTSEVSEFSMEGEVEQPSEIFFDENIDEEASIKGEGDEDMELDEVGGRRSLATPDASAEGETGGETEGDTEGETTTDVPGTPTEADEEMSPHPDTDAEEVSEIPAGTPPDELQEEPPEASVDAPADAPPEV